MVHTTVPVIKDDGSIRICGDYKLTVNQVSELDNYTIPKMSRICQIRFETPLSANVTRESSRKLLTINTHLELFKPTRLAFGVK